MGKVVTMHQPNYLPWLGFFSKIKNSDCFVILDDVKYTKNGFVNRNKIRIKEGWCYLTIPVGKKYTGSKINEVKLPEKNYWQKEHWQSIEGNYKKTEYFYSYADFFKNLYSKKFEYLWQINLEIILYLFRCFDIQVEILKASKLNIDPNLLKSDRIISILKATQSEIYLSGPSGKDYLQPEKFKENNIELRFFKYELTTYKQRYPEFEPNMAAIDLLFNVGEKSKEYL